MIQMTIPQFHARLKAQGVSDHIDTTFRCPMCKTLQSPRDLIAAGAGTSFEEVEKFAGFSCVGRFTGAPSPRRKPDGQPCNWTLGGLLRLHNVEIIDADGKPHPFFDIATPEEAQAHAAQSKARAS